ncbi:MAG: hypothetical protein LBH65_02870 [Desulfovibrio sp.]|jgi:hypothetical protein|nr:hypothetical protein [Desulfovibrio sp.]
MRNISTPSQSAPVHDESLEHMEERGMGEAQRVSLTASPRMRLFAVVINFLVISELFVAMYFASQTPDRLTPVFFKIFFGLLVPTLVVAFVGRRLIAKAER